MTLQTEVQTLIENRETDQTEISPLSNGKRKWDIVWRNVVLFVFLHIGAVYGFYLAVYKAMLQTFFYAYCLGFFSGLGITAGAHRLWAHKTYKARLPLRIMLMLFNVLALQDSVITWVRDHRMHHKYSDTDADPYNAKRGFFFSHIGWLLVRKHPDIKAKGNTIEMSDIYNDPVLTFQKRYYLVLVPLICLFIPLYVPTLWGESLWNALFVCVIFRYICTLNSTWLVNSAAHMWGYKPYDKNIDPVENKIVSFLVLGEGFHNYHHTFPWDYKTAELGDYSLNVTKLFIDFMAAIGWAYDLRTVSNEVVSKRIQRTGGGSINRLIDNEHEILADK